MSLRGSLATMPALDVLWWAAKRRHTAVITFEREREVRSIAVADGSIVSTTSAIADEQIGTILVKSGKLAEQALLDALETRSAIGVPLGRVLQMSGSVSEQDLVEVLTVKAHETVLEVATWVTGNFELTLRATAMGPGISAPVDIAACISDAGERAGRLAAALDLLGGDATSFYVPHTSSGQPDFENSDTDPEIDVARLWTLVGSGIAVARLAAVFGGRRSRVVDFLATWVERGFLVVDRRKISTENATSTLIATAKTRLAAGDRAAALRSAQKALDLEPNNAEVRSVFASVERSHVAYIARRLLACVAAPRPTGIDLSTINLSPLEQTLLSRIDGQWDALSLVRGIAVREADAIVAIGSLAALGAIELE